ncbi:glucose transporter [Achlya hypogyna]|uniref:Hexose transporter 1 n=1 Tax=Achlya hypogyna TaxID=1202772 RepID=A0A1V9Z0V4_ACHHY|nr:glucose transporter [Achlya hypogyna]
MTVSETLGQLFQHWRKPPVPVDSDSDGEGGDVYLPVADLLPPAPASAPARSWRRHRHTTARRRLSKLESMVHADHAEALEPAGVLYATVAIALLGACQFGWLLSQLNYEPFNSNCAALPVAPGDCLLFPPHTETQWTLAVSAWIAGGAVGAICSGLPADLFGRKKTLLVNAGIAIFGALVQAFATTLGTFAAGRLLSGVASGVAINVCEALISEISPPRMRGTFLTGLQVGVAIGSLAVTSAHYALSEAALRWRLLFGFPAVLGGLQLALAGVMARSPVWLVSHGRLDDAAGELARLYRPCRVDAIVAAMAAAHREEQAELAGRPPRALLFSAPYRRQLVIAIVLCAAQQLCGTPAIMYYSSTLFARAGIADPRVGNSVVNAVRTGAILTAAIVVDKWPRRTLLMGGMATQAIAAVGLVASLEAASPVGSIVATAVFIVGFCLSIGPLAWTVSSEIFPDYMQASAGSVGTMATWIGDLLVGLVYPSLARADALGNYAFGVFAVLLAAFVLFVWIVVPETNGHTAVEIQAAFGHADLHAPLDDDEAAADPWATELKSL